MYTKKWLNFSLAHLSCYRTELMGVAALMIITCHGYRYFSLPPILGKIILLGNLGVEIFFFLSGLGLAYSLENLSVSIHKWYKKRYFRILVPYFLIAIPWYAIRMYLDDSSFLFFLSEVSTLSYWMYHRGAWFIALLLPLYLVTPLIHKIIKSKYGLIFLFVSIGLIVPLGLIKVDNAVVDNILSALNRLPCFFVGIFIAQYVREARSISLFWTILLVLLSMYVLRCIDKEIGWLWPLALLFIILSSYALHYFQAIRKPLCIVGLMSLESYIMNLCLINLCGTSVSYWIIAVCGLGIGWGVHLLSGIIVNKVKV